MKRNFYIFCAIILGLLLGTITHALVELWIIRYVLSLGAVPVAYWSFRSGCYLPISATLFFLVIGAVLGFFLGRRWWQIVYVEKRHWCMRDEK